MRGCNVCGCAFPCQKIPVSQHPPIKLEQTAHRSKQLSGSSAPPYGIVNMEKYLELCNTCREIKLEDYLYQANYPGTVELGRFQDVAKRNHCSLCRLVIQALNSHSRKHWKS